MSFVLRLFLLFFFIIGGLSWFILQKSLDTLDNSVRQSAEEVMVDSANFIAELVSQNVIDGEIQLHQIHNLIPAYLERRLSAEIYTVIKKTPDMQVYITDQEGRVLYDSLGQSEGQDFSKWNDVYLTLQGKYGVRTSAIEQFPDMADTAEKALFIAAPVEWKNEIIGVVTVSKGIAHLDPFIVTASRQLSRYALFVLAASIFFGILMTWWLSKSMRKLVNYADQLGSRQPAPQPKLREHEFVKLADAMQQMQIELEDKEYIENYLHSVAHELKSPLTSLRASAELMLENQDESQRNTLAANISDSSERMNLLVERMLNLASVEKRRHLDKLEALQIDQLLERIVHDRQARLQQAKVSVDLKQVESIAVQGDPLLLEQALANIIDNAIEFSPANSTVSIQTTSSESNITVHVDDQGPGIPTYAKEKVFERFYSLPRPADQQRSTGLGLSFVQEVMKLHQGSVSLDPIATGGTRATLSWQIQPKLPTNHAK